MSCWACQNDRIMFLPLRYSASTCSWPRVSMRIDRPSARITAVPIGGSSESLSQVSTGFRSGLPIGHILKLHSVEPLILPSAKQQFVVGSDLDDRTAIHDHDPIGPLYRRQAVGDHDCGSVLHQITQCQLDN